MLTHAYVHWLADPDKSGQAMHSGSFAPALASQMEHSVQRIPPNAHSLGRQTAQKHRRMFLL